MAWLRSLFLLLAATTAASATGAQSQQFGILRSVFAHHDTYGRLPNTDIRYAGSVRIGRNLYQVYDLDFVNPLSKHGMQRIAIVMNGKTFLGSYQTEGQAISVRGRQVLSSPDLFCKTMTSFRLDGPRLPKQVFFACDMRELEDTI